jgi:hypothetical protein
MLCAVLFSLAITVFSAWPLFGVFMDAPVLPAVAGLMMMPGALLAMIVAGNPHAFNRWVVVLSNLTFYTGVAYALLGIGPDGKTAKGKKSREGGS